MNCIYEIDRMKTSVNIWNAINNSGMTYETIAEKLSVSLQSIYKWTNSRGKGIPTIDHFVVLAGILKAIPHK